MTITVAIFIAILIAITITDAKTLTIPVYYNVAIFALGVISIWTVGGQSILSRILGLVCISVPMLLLVLIIPGGFGFGDIKLMAAAGFFLGWKTTLVSFFIALIAGSLWACILLATKKATRKDHFAFGPFLCVGMLIGLFFANDLIAGYFKLGELIYLNIAHN